MDENDGGNESEEKDIKSSIKSMRAVEELSVTDEDLMGTKVTTRRTPVMAYSARKVLAEEIRKRPVATPAVITLKFAQVNESGKSGDATPDDKDNTSSFGSSVSSKSSETMLIKGTTKQKKKEIEKKSIKENELEHINEINELMSGISQTEQSCYSDDESSHRHHQNIRKFSNSFAKHSDRGGSCTRSNPRRHSSQSVATKKSYTLSKTELKDAAPISPRSPEIHKKLKISDGSSSPDTISSQSDSPKQIYCGENEVE